MLDQKPLSMTNLISFTVPVLSESENKGDIISQSSDTSLCELGVSESSIRGSASGFSWIYGSSALPIPDLLVRSDLPSADPPLRRCPR